MTLNTVYMKLYVPHNRVSFFFSTLIDFISLK